MGRRGMILAFTFTALLLLGALALAFHQSSRWAQHAAGRFQQGEVLRRVVEAGIDEAFSRAWALLGDAGSTVPELRSWLLERRPTTLPIDLPLTAGWARGLFGGGRDLRLTATVQHRDFRDRDSRGSRYAPGEGVGSVVFRVVAELLDRHGHPEKACTIIRVHDFKIVALATPGSAATRASYVQHFPLDYHLLVRHGLTEFVRTQGASVNPVAQKLVLDQASVPVDRRGAVFFGGTGHSPPPGLPPDAPDHVFLNLDSVSGSVLMPSFPAMAELARVDRDVCLQLVPDLQPFRADLAGLEGVFSSALAPVAGTPLAVADPAVQQAMTRIRAALQAGAVGPLANLNPGIDLLGPVGAPTVADPAFAGSVLLGRLRQRFLAGVLFHLDLSHVSGSTGAQTATLQQWANRWPCFPPPPGPPLPNDFRVFLAQVGLMQQARGPGQPSLLSALRSDFPYQAGQDASIGPTMTSFPAPRFYDFRGNPIAEHATGKQGFRPFRHYNLYGRRFVNAGELESAGIIDRAAGAVRLRGVISVDGPLELGEPNRPWLIHGQGVLIAPRVRVLGGLTKAGPSDLAIVFARLGEITVETSQELHVGLIAINDGLSGRVRANQPLNLLGNLVVDELDLPNWTSAGPHLIRFDPAFRVDQPVLQVDLSPWITFQRVIDQT
jgi:hypothetical protein